MKKIVKTAIKSTMQQRMHRLSNSTNCSKTAEQMQNLYNISAI